MKTAFVLFVFIFVASEDSLYSQYANYRPYPSNRHQIEPFIVRHPLNQQILFASAYTISNLGFRREGVYVSTNGGLNWWGADSVIGTNQGTHGGDPGPIIDKDGRFILTHQGGFQTGMFSNYSTNQGLSWSETYPILTGDQDKGSPGTDDAPTSSFYGKTYLAWTRFSPPYPIVISYTSNGGVNWSSIIQINNSCGSNRSFGPSIGISPTGTVYVAWSSAIPTSPFTEDWVGFAKSTNGGINWSVTECAIDCNGIRTSILSPWNIRANSFPTIDVDKTGGSRNGWIYIAITNKNLAPAGSDPDIVFHRSTDGGNTWSAGVRVNQDPINNGRNQFFPALRVDEDGGVNIIYYDSRNFADSVDIYLSRSDNGGISWNDYRVTQSRFRPVPVSGAGGSGNMGDNIGLTSGNGNLYPVWMANYTGIFQVWSAIIDYTTIGIKRIGTEIPKEFELKQNYPNPFNPVTNIRFDVPIIEAHRNVSLQIYNVLGREVTTLINEQLNPGTYEIQWDASNYPSGVYLYQLKASEFSETRKMVVVK
ncbi:MAG: T9SS type A sorting domain-containing protein [Chlorobi bacterium]|nr:T9SS type A sorting domain-containing protein [Chlorobiota bacterium]MCI0715423.1 T9SS type A sorting domain-containing protein [Chlorobiota bacterium]